MKKFYELLVIAAIFAAAVFGLFSIVLTFLSIAEVNAPVTAIIEAKETILGLEMLSLAGLTISLVGIAGFAVSFMWLDFVRDRLQYGGKIEAKKSIVYAWMMTALLAVLIILLTGKISPQEEILWRFAAVLGNIVGYSFGASALIASSLFAKEEFAERIRREEIGRQARENQFPV